MDAKKRLSELDLLRFLAALAVVFYHRLALEVVGRPVYDGAQFGFLGVELFFMISGFVILWTASNRTAMQFAASRLARLYPSFWLAVGLTTVVILAAGESVTLWQFVANLTMIPATLKATPVDVVYWTLALEIKFYALIFALLLFRQLKHIEAVLTVWLGVCILARYFPLSFFTLNGYAPFFVAGCAIYLLREQHTRARTALLIIALMLGMEQAVKTPQAANLFSHPAMAPSIIAGIVMAEFGVFYAVAMGKLRLPHSKLWGILGAMTYPLYLLHDKIGEVVWGISAAPWLKQIAALSVGLILALIFALTIEKYGVRAFNNLLLRAWTRVQPRGSLPLPATTESVLESSPRS